MSPGRRPATRIVHPGPDEPLAVGARAAPDPTLDIARASRRWLAQVCPVDEDFRLEARRRWRIATGRDSDNPEQASAPSIPRSAVRRERPDPAAPAIWHKEYLAQYNAYQTHEMLVLTRLASLAGENRNPRDHHARVKQVGDASDPARGTRIDCVITEDAGPNLLCWHYFQPLVAVGPHRWVLPLLAHPTFLAALAYRLLLALDVLFEHEVVHLDLKPENIGLALPELSAQDGVLHGEWPLQSLPTKLLDFECSVDRTRRYPGMPPGNDYVSPFARARLKRAAAESGQAQAWEQAVDWGADLFALGHMLAFEPSDDAYAMPASAVWALQLLQAYRQAQRNAPELGPLAHESLGLAQEQDKLAQDLHWLQTFGRELMALDRPEADAALAPAQLPQRPPPLAGLRQALARRFPVLQEGARSQSLRFFFDDPQPPFAAAGDPPDERPPKSRLQRVGDNVAAPRLGARPPRPRPLRDLEEIVPADTEEPAARFILIPNPGPVVLGRGPEALTVHMHHRYAIGRTPVTVGQWKAFWNSPDRDRMAADANEAEIAWADPRFADDERKPVVGIDALDAEAYVRWFSRRYAASLSERLGRRVSFDLPTELEFEFAARGGRFTQDCLWEDGASEPEKYRHAQIRGWFQRTAPVGSKLPNGYGLFDTIGNTWEWQSSPWRERRSDLPLDGLEPGPAGVSAMRAVRGASFLDRGDALRLTYRAAYAPVLRSHSIGFRLVARIAAE